MFAGIWNFIVKAVISFLWDQATDGVKDALATQQLGKRLKEKETRIQELEIQVDVMLKRGTPLTKEEIDEINRKKAAAEMGGWNSP